MTLPASGLISLSQVNVELGLGGTTPVNLNQSNVRALAGVPSGTISMSSLRGKSLAPTYTHTLSPLYSSDGMGGYYCGHQGFIAPDVTDRIAPSLFGSYYISALYTLSNGGTNTPLLIMLGTYPYGGVVPYSAFTSIKCLELGWTVFAASASHNGAASTFTSWYWTGMPGFVSGQTYHLVIT